MLHVYIFFIQIKNRMGVHSIMLIAHILKYELSQPIKLQFSTARFAFGPPKSGKNILFYK